MLIYNGSTLSMFLFDIRIIPSPNKILVVVRLV